MLRFLLLAAAILLAPIPASAQDAPQRKAGEVVLESATVGTTATGKVDFELGTLFVPENRSEPKSRLIGVGFARFRGLPGAAAPPIFMLPGGPGGSFVSSLKPGGFRLTGLLQSVQKFRAVGDVILVDQRGFSERGDVLQFPYRTPDLPLDQPGSLARTTTEFKKMAQAAVAEFAEKKIDLRGYTVKECADDVHDLCKALEYKQLMLVGGSFGSQWSFAIMRRHPQIVARALLSGVEPLDCGYDMPSHVLAAVQRMWWEAEKDLRFKPYLPPGGLMGAAREVLRRLERAPVRVTLPGVKDSQTGEAATIVLGMEDFQRDAFTRGMAGPAFVLAIYHGQYDQWAFNHNITRRGRNVEMPLIPPLIDSSLGVTPQRRYLLRTDPAGEYLGHWNFDRYLATAEIWPSPDVGDDFRTEIVVRIPVVFVHGDWDTQTPVENTLQAAPFFPNGHVLLVERGGHGAMGQIAQHLPKTEGALLDYLKTGSMAHLPTRVTLPAPTFSVPSFPAPKK